MLGGLEPTESRFKYACAESIIDRGKFIRMVVVAKGVQSIGLLAGIMGVSFISD